MSAAESVGASSGAPTAGSGSSAGTEAAGAVPDSIPAAVAGGSTVAAGGVGSATGSGTGSGGGPGTGASPGAGASSGAGASPGAGAPSPAVAAMVEAIRAGSRSHIARGITLVESSRPNHRDQARELLAALSVGGPSGAVRVGVSGVPGSGKSTFIDAMGVRLIEAGHKVAVLAVDPSSSRTGGSILGDRTRMGSLAVSENAFVRPSPSGGHLGGVARATRESMIVMEAAGYDVVIVETVGVGQSEIAVADMVDTFLMLTLARAGDQLQGIKRGILERADVIAVNKADGDHEGDARVAARELSGVMKLMTSEPGAKPAPVLTCSAMTGKGLDEVWQAVLDHRAHLEETGSLDERRADQHRQWMWAMVESELIDLLRHSASVRAEQRAIEAAVTAGTTSALDGMERILDLFTRDLTDRGWR